MQCPARFFAELLQRDFDARRFNIFFLSSNSPQVTAELLSDLILRF
jgi:hypothetical protein